MTDDPGYSDLTCRDCGESRSRAERWFIQGCVALAIAAVMFVLLVESSGRGFLPSSQRSVWVAIEPLTGDVRLIGDGDEPPDPSGVEGTIIGIIESSMGRTNYAGMQEWRASHWTIWLAYDDTAQQTEQLLDDATTVGRLHAFIKTQLVPASAAMSHWPGVPGEWSAPTAPGQWSYHQKRWHRGRCAVIVVVPLAAAVMSLVVFGGLRSWCRQREQGRSMRQCRT